MSDGDTRRCWRSAAVRFSSSSNSEWTCFEANSPITTANRARIANVSVAEMSARLLSEGFRRIQSRATWTTVGSECFRSSGSFSANFGPASAARLSMASRRTDSVRESRYGKSAAAASS